MTKVLVSESYLSDIAQAIRAKNGSADTYKPGEMAAAIGAIPTGGSGIVVRPLSVSENGTYTAAEGSAYNPVVVEVPESQPNLQSKTATENGTVTPDEGYDGLSSVVVNVASGNSDYPVIDALYVDEIKYFEASVKGTYYPPNLSPAVKAFMAGYARSKYGTAQNGVDMGKTITLTPSIVREPVSDFLQRFNTLQQAEYYGSAYGNTAMIEELGLVLLGDFSQQGEASGNALSDSIEGYSAVLLQGIYQKQRTSQYNTSMLYIVPELNAAYWTGMKDRNSSYGCNVTFTDSRTVSLTGNRQVIIYGVP